MSAFYANKKGEINYIDLYLHSMAFDGSDRPETIATQVKKDYELFRLQITIVLMDLKL